MKKTTTKKKTNKKLISALGMFMLSAAMLGTSTYAWFTMNKVVEVKDMQVKAVAEDGLLINEVQAADDAHWDSEATAAQTGTTLSALYPASTANGTTWYHAASKKSYSSASATSGEESHDLVVGEGATTGYETLASLMAITAMSEGTASGGTNAAYSTMGKSATDPAGYYVHYTYYLKGASGSALPLATSTGAAYDVYIKSVTATQPTTAESANLNKSLRVGIKLNSAFYIYNPLGGTNSYFVNAGTTATTTIPGNTATATDLASLPAVGSPGAPVDVYIWYEGEDADCKSDNALATTLDNISVKIEFELKAKNN